MQVEAQDCTRRISHLQMGQVVLAIAGLGGVAALIAVGVVASSKPSAAAVPAALPVAAAVTLNTAAQTAEGLGLSPEVIVASGCTAGEARTLMSAIDANQRSVLEVERREQDVSNVGAVLIESLADLDAEPLNPEFRRRAADTRQALTIAQERAEAARRSLRETILDSLERDQRIRCERCLTQIGTTAPVECRVLAWDEETIGGLELALIAERRADRMNESLGDEEAELIEQIRSDPEYIRARVNLDSHLASVRAVYDQWR